MIASLLLMAGLGAAHPAPLHLAKCEVSKLWGTALPAEMPEDQDRHVLLVQDKRIYWNTRSVTVERAVAEIGPDMAIGTDLLVIDASDAKCATVRQLADAIEGPAACTPARCIVSAKMVPPRTAPKTP